MTRDNDTPLTDAATFKVEHEGDTHYVVHSHKMERLERQLAEAVQSQSDLTDQLKIREAELQQTRRDKERLAKWREVMIDYMTEFPNSELCRRVATIDAATRKDAQ